MIWLAKSVLSELVRIDSAKITNVPPYLATDTGRDGVKNLPKGIKDVRTVKELLESGYFKKNNQGTILMDLVLEK